MKYFLILFCLLLGACNTTVNCNATGTCNPTVNITGNTITVDGETATKLPFLSFDGERISQIGQVLDRTLEEIEVHPETNTAYMVDDTTGNIKVHHDHHFKSVPIGEFDYYGVNIIKDDVPNQLQSDFHMTVNFHQGTGTVNAHAPHELDENLNPTMSTIVGGTITVNNRTGVLEDKDIRIYVGDYIPHFRDEAAALATSPKGEMYGQFTNSHGIDAVRAIYHGNDVSGLLIGTRIE